MNIDSRDIDAIKANNAYIWRTYYARPFKLIWHGTCFVFTSLAVYGILRLWR